MSRARLIRKLVFTIMAGVIIPSLACNFPFPTADTGSRSQLAQTLTAMAPLTTGEVIVEADGLVTQEIQPTDIGSNEPQPDIQPSRPSPLQLDDSGQVFIYYTQPGDTLQGLAKRFDVEPDQITSPFPIPQVEMFPSGQELLVPNQVGDPGYGEFLLPDSEVLYSPSTKGFEIEVFVREADGYLNGYSETVKGDRLSGAEIVTKVAVENSINPRILLALLEWRSGWVYGQTGQGRDQDFPLGFGVPDYKGLYYELVLAATHLGVGYYGWRSGERTFVSFPDDSLLRLNPGLNPGTVALQAVLSKLAKQEEWRQALYTPDSFLALYARMFGDPWRRAAQVEPLVAPGIHQPVLELPFSPGERWSFTGGPHRSWNAGSPRGALDFSPATGEPPCTTSRAWVTASADGVITRTSDNVVALDLDGDGHEGTGWVLVYLHISEPEGFSPGSQVTLDGRLGHPSCERGNSTGTHVHLARKYNGEWLPAGGSVPFTLSGWEVHAGERSYQGELRRGDQVVSANSGGPSSSIVVRD